MKLRKFVKHGNGLQPMDKDTSEWLDGMQAGAAVTLQQKDPKRSLDQNAMLHAMYSQVARVIEWTEREVAHYCKLSHGVPILRRDNEEFADWASQTLDAMPYPIQLQSMEYLPVTRIMTKKQCTEYIDAIIMDFSSQGVPIVLPGDQHAA